MESEGMPKPENHGRDHAMSAAALIAEYLANRYSLSWLIWVGGCSLFLAFLGYSRHYLSTKSKALQYGSRIGAALLLLIICVAITGVRLWPKFGSRPTTSVMASQQTEPKKPDVHQSSQGANSPNTTIIGNNNTVVNNDPKLLAEMRNFLKAQGDRIAPEKLLVKYPLGYVIFDVDYMNGVFPYQTKGLVQWDIDWSLAKLVEDGPNNVLITMPGLKQKRVNDMVYGTVITGNSMSIPKKVGPMAGSLFLDNTIDMKAEILAIRENGIIFLIGIRHANIQKK